MMLKSAFELAVTSVRNHRFALAALLLPFAVRAIPEIIAGPYPIGWDTIAFYVPTTLDWAAGKDSLLFMIGEAPLLYMITVPTYFVSRIDPVWIFKILGPIFYGSMTLALYRFLRLGLSWPERLSFYGSVLTSLYFVTLRISWDLFRNELGLTFVLLSLPFLTRPMNRRNEIGLASMVALAIASNQLTGAISLAIVGARAIMVIKKNSKEFLNLVKISIPGIALFSFMTYAEFTSTTNLFPRQPSPVTIPVLNSTIPVLLWAYLPLAPLAYFGAKRFRNIELLSWAGFCIAACVITSFPQSGLVAISYRWAILLTVPIVVFAVEGAVSLSKTISPPHTRLTLLRRNALGILGIALVMLAGLYVLLPAQQAFPYYIAYPAFVPTSMLQSTVPVSDMPNLVHALDWAAASIKPGMALISDVTVYGFARDYFPLQNRIVDYGYDRPAQGIQMATSAGFSSIIMIGWAPGQGWYDPTAIPTSLVPVHQVGSMEVYATMGSL